MEYLWSALNIKRHPWIISIILLITLWYVASARQWVGKTLLASPYEVVQVFIRAFDTTSTKKSEKVHIHALHTIRRALEGWALALALGIVCGLGVGSLFVIFIGSEPVVEFARSIPPVMAFPLFLVAFNYGEPAYIWSIVFGCLPIMILAVSRGVRDISGEKLELLTVYRVRALVRWFAMSMEILPSVFLGARLTLTVALVIAVVTEMVFSPRSGWALGTLARDSEIDFDTPTFYACVMIIGVFGFIANVALRKVEQRLDLQTVVRGNISGQ